MQTRAHGGEVIGIEGVSLIYRSRNAEVHALDNISFAAADREFVALVGPSGCGKSTLLKLISGLLPHYSGMVRVNGGRFGSSRPAGRPPTPAAVGTSG